MSQPHWYLFVIGIHPEYQRNGYGSLLINEFLRSCEIYNLRIYLETHEQENLEYFQKFRFTILEIGVLPNSEIKNWCLGRRPT